MPKFLVTVSIIVVILLAVGYIAWPNRSIAPSPSLSSQPVAIATAPEATLTLDEPVADFKTRITKKPFGLFVEPNNSPVQPEKFSGYHTGVDVEYGDVKEEVPVKTIADGKIIHAGTAQGYGGVVAIQYEIDNQAIVAIYGHLDPAALPDAGTTVKAGDTIGRLGDGFTPETDGERKHLHLSLHKGTTLNIRGYVQNQSELSDWLDPLSIF